MSHEFINRQQELAILTSAFQEPARPTSLIEIIGVPGIGKTRLLDEFSQRLNNDQVVRISFAEFRQHPSPATAVIQHIIDHAPIDRTTRLLASENLDEVAKRLPTTKDFFNLMGTRHFREIKEEPMRPINLARINYSHALRTSINPYAICIDDLHDNDQDAHTVFKEFLYAPLNHFPQPPLVLIARNAPDGAYGPHLRERKAILPLRGFTNEDVNPTHNNNLAIRLRISAGHPATYINLNQLPQDLEKSLQHMHDQMWSGTYFGEDQAPADWLDKDTQTVVNLVASQLKRVDLSTLGHALHSYNPNIFPPYNDDSHRLYFSMLNMLKSQGILSSSNRINIMSPYLSQFPQCYYRRFPSPQINAVHHAMIKMMQENLAKAKDDNHAYLPKDVANFRSALRFHQHFLKTATRNQLD